MVIRVPDQRNTPGGYSALDDRMLVLDFQAGNPQAFVEIHRRYGGLARHVCQRFLPRQPDVDEAFQETMIRVFQGLYRFNGRYALQPWIARIAKNVSLDTLRGHARRPQTDDSAPNSDELAIPGDEADEIVERLVQRDTVLSVLADLPETHRKALMLRELEGRSHREVAEEMEISTAQAKALIHRAKGSFRRHWLEKVADRGGLVAVAFLPLLWAAKFAHGLRRVVDKVGFAAQGAQAAAPEAVTSVSTTVTATAAPAATGVAERVVAAGMTILLAGGVTVGAAKIVHSNHGPDQRAAAAPVALVEVPSSVPAHVERDVAPPRDRLADSRRIQQGKIEAEPPVEVAPTEDQQPTTEAPPTDPSPSPEPSPTPEPTPTEPPGPPPAPEWSFGFTISGLGSSGCSCGSAAQLESSSVQQSDGSVSFSQAVRGTATAPDGTPIIEFYVEQSGTANASDGTLTTTIVLGTDSGPVWYDATATLAAVEDGKSDSRTYWFNGAYQLRAGQFDSAVPAPAGLPQRGRLVASIGIWQDGTIYIGDLHLLEA